MVEIHDTNLHILVHFKKSTYHFPAVLESTTIKSHAACCRHFKESIILHVIFVLAVHNLSIYGPLRTHICDCYKESDGNG